MFERFTDRARGVVTGAVEQARALGHGYVGTEHLLLAMFGSGGIADSVLRSAGIEAQQVRDGIERATRLDTDALESIGIDLNVVREKVEETFGKGALDEMPPPRRRGWFRRRMARSHKPFTGRAKVVLELSLREAIALKHNYIGTEHILLGLLREGKGLGAKILADAGGDLARLREQTIAAAERGLIPPP